MPQVRGKSVRPAGMLMTLYPDRREEVDDFLYKAAGKHRAKWTLTNVLTRKPTESS